MVGPTASQNSSYVTLKLQVLSYCHSYIHDNDDDDDDDDDDGDDDDDDDSNDYDEYPKLKQKFDFPEVCYSMYVPKKQIQHMNHRF